MAQQNYPELPAGSNPVAKDRISGLRAGGDAFFTWDDVANGLRADAANYVATTAGPGITEGTGTVIKTSVSRVGDIITTTILIDLTGLNCGATAGDIIGVDGSGAAYLAQITAARNGTLFGGRMVCLETPAGGDTDIDLYSATEATGVEDTAITALAETQLINAGAAALGTEDFMTALPAADEYLYLVGQGTGNATYTAGRLLIELVGYA